MSGPKPHRPNLPWQSLVILKEWKSKKMNALLAFYNVSRQDHMPLPNMLVRRNITMDIDPIPNANAPNGRLGRGNK